MKLELKHLAPYLPYKLKYLVDAEIYELDGLDVNGDAFNADTGEIPFNIIEPILRPLSDLKTSDIDFTEYFKNRFDMDSWTYLWDVPYSDMERLFQNHFDVFGLINKELAIDINTLESDQ